MPTGYCPSACCWSSRWLFTVAAIMLRGMDNIMYRSGCCSSPCQQKRADSGLVRAPLREQGMTAMQAAHKAASVDSAHPHVLAGLCRGRPAHALGHGAGAINQQYLGTAFRRHGGDGVAHRAVRPFSMRCSWAFPANCGKRTPEPGKAWRGLTGASQPLTRRPPAWSESRSRQEAHDLSRVSFDARPPTEPLEAWR
ncbi:MAG: hypothetical protein ACLRWP_12995 [Bilophila wadsworthia]